MRDAMASASAVFEPEEVSVLGSAVRLAMKKLDALGGGDRPGCEAEVAKIVHNLGRTRVRLKKPMQTRSHAAEIAEEAVELFAYLEAAPDAVLAAARDHVCLPKQAERIVGAFPRAFRQPRSTASDRPRAEASTNKSPGCFEKADAALQGSLRVRRVTRDMSGSQSE